MDLKINADRFKGEEYVETYHQFRPSPPEEIVWQCLNYLDRKKARSLIDLGSGTGISTRIWEEHAAQLIGIEPSGDMLEFARNQNKSSDIKYLKGFSDDIDLPKESADIVSCSQAFHWMNPVSTLKEVNRILKKKGVFVVMDAMWPPGVNLAYEKAYIKLFNKVENLSSQLVTKKAIRWSKSEHLKNINSSGYFTFVKQTYFNKTVPFNKEQFIGVALSQGGLEALKRIGLSDKELELVLLKEKLKH